MILAWFRKSGKRVKIYGQSETESDNHKSLFLIMSYHFKCLSFATHSTQQELQAHCRWMLDREKSFVPVSSRFRS